MIIGLSGTGKTTTTLHDAERLAAGAGRLRRADARRQAVRHRERLLREDVLRSTPTSSRQHLRRRRQADDLPGERVPGRGGHGELLRGELHAERARGVPRWTDLARATADATDVGTVDYLLILNRNENIIPAVAKLDQEQAAAYFMLGETTGTCAGGAVRGRQVPARPRHEPVLPAAARPAGQPDPRAARDAPDRDLPAEHRAASGAGTTTSARRS